MQAVTDLEDLSSKQPQNIHIVVDDYHQDTTNNLKNENEILRNEIRSLSSEISLLLNLTKSSERG